MGFIGRLRSSGMVLGTILAAAACGPSYDVAYQSSYSTCSAMDRDPMARNGDRMQCWSSYSQYYAGSEPPERIQHARQRVAALRGAQASSGGEQYPTPGAQPQGPWGAQNPPPPGYSSPQNPPPPGWGQPQNPPPPAWGQAQNPPPAPGWGAPQNPPPPGWGTPQNPPPPQTVAQAGSRVPPPPVAQQPPVVNPPPATPPAANPPAANPPPVSAQPPAPAASPAPPPGAACADACRQSWSGCQTQCGSGALACDARCDDTYRDCMRGCF